MYRLSFLLLFASGLLAQVEKDGLCDLTANAVQNLDLTQVMGTWHQIARITNQNETGDCSVLSFNGTYEEGNLVDVDFSMSEVVGETRKERHGKVFQVTASGIYQLRFNDNSEMVFTVQSMIYDRFAVLYSCATIGTSKKYVWAWQYHRNATITSDQRAVLNWFASLSPDLKDVTWKNTQEAAVCKNKGVPRFWLAA